MDSYSDIVNAYGYLYVSGFWTISGPDSVFFMVWILILSIYIIFCRIRRQSLTNFFFDVRIWIRSITSKSLAPRIRIMLNWSWLYFVRSVLPKTTTVTCLYCFTQGFSLSLSLTRSRSRSLSLPLATTSTYRNLLNCLYAPLCGNFSGFSYVNYINNYSSLTSKRLSLLNSTQKCIL